MADTGPEDADDIPVLSGVQEVYCQKHPTITHKKILKRRYITEPLQ